jgi:hypothetical protein
MTSCVIICKTDDGKILVNAAGGEQAQAYLEGATEVPSLEEAVAMVPEVLGAVPAAGEGEQEQAAPSGSEGMPMATPEDQMEAGFHRAKKGY